MIIRTNKEELSSLLGSTIDIKKANKMIFANKGITAKTSISLIGENLDLEISFSRKAFKDPFLKEALEELMAEIISEMKENVPVMDPAPAHA